jgi:hypothetical protein
MATLVNGWELGEINGKMNGWMDWWMAATRMCRRTDGGLNKSLTYELLIES